MVSPFEVALNIEKQDLTTSLHEKRTYFLKTQYTLAKPTDDKFSIYMNSICYYLERLLFFLRRETELF